MKFLTSELSQDSFESMDLPAYILETLSKLKITTPTQVQKQALPLALSGADFVGLAQTGSGKTLVYLAAILARIQHDQNSRALVLTPSRETASQIFSVLERLIGDEKISRALIISGQPTKEQTSKLKKNPQVIVATPGRLLDHLSGNKLLLQKLSIFVIDEADRMLDDGFGPQLKNIKSTLRGTFQTIMLGASFTKGAEKFSEGFFRPECYLLKITGAEKPVENLRQIVMFIDQGSKNDRVMDALKEIKGQAIIFVNNQPNSEVVQKHLKANNVSVDVVHGGFETGHRERVIRDFRNEKFRVLVTTDLIARGLDFPKITLVINFDLPNENEDFLHRIGRTARAGQRGTAITMISRYDERLYKQFKVYLENAQEVRENDPFTN